MFVCFSLSKYLCSSFRECTFHALIALKAPFYVSQSGKGIFRIEILLQCTSIHEALSKNDHDHLRWMPASSIME